MAEAMTQPSVRTRVAKWLAQDHARLHMLFRKAGAANPRQLAAALLAMILGAFTLRSLDVAGVPIAYAEPQLLNWLAAAVTTAKRVRKPAQP